MAEDCGAPPPLGPVVAAAEPLPRFAESPCSCRPTAVISAVFPLKISMRFALNLSGDRVKRKIQLEGSRGGSLSLHGWALNTCNSDTSVSCGPESCFSFVAPQMLQLWEKNKNSFPLEWLLGRRLQRWEEIHVTVVAKSAVLQDLRAPLPFFFIFSDSKVCFYADGHLKWCKQMKICIKANLLIAIN